MVQETTTASTGHEIAPGSRARQLLRVARERLDDVAQLPEDWDSYGAARPNLVAISIAHDLLTGLWRRLSDTIPEAGAPWMIAPLADGGVQLEWRGRNGAIEVEIASTGPINFLVEQDERTLRRSDPTKGASSDQILDQIIDVIAGPSAA